MIIIQQIKRSHRVLLQVWQYAFKRPREDTKYSMLTDSFQLTTKDQTLILLKNSIFSKNNKFFFLVIGDIRSFPKRLNGPA